MRKYHPTGSDVWAGFLGAKGMGFLDAEKIRETGE